MMTLLTSILFQIAIIPAIALAAGMLFGRKTQHRPEYDRIQ